MSDILELALCHHGIEGMHWGERRYQNYDGSLTDEGRRRYNVGYKQMKRTIKEAKRETAEAGYFARESQKEFGTVGRVMQEKFAKDYLQKEAELKQLVQNAKDQYGDTKIKDIKYKTFYDAYGRPQSFVNESTVTAKDVSSAMAKTFFGTTAMAAFGIPFAYISIPTSTAHNKKAYKNATKQFYNEYYRNQNSKY